MQKIAFPGPGIYRGMEEENGAPKVGDSAKLLGVRFPPHPNPDLEFNQNGKISPLGPSEPQGMPCAPRIQDLPLHRRPAAWAGKEKKTNFKVWKIREADLGRDLVALQDTPFHITIGAAREMSADEFRAALAATQSSWVAMEPTP